MILVLKTLHQKNLYSKLEKYKFQKKEINFLGFIVKENRIYINLDKI